MHHIFVTCLRNSNSDARDALLHNGVFVSFPRTLLRFNCKIISRYANHATAVRDFLLMILFLPFPLEPFLLLLFSECRNRVEPEVACQTFCKTSQRVP